MKQVVGMGMAAIGLAMVAGCVYVPPEQRPPHGYYREPHAVIIVGGHDHDHERRMEPRPLPRRDMERRDRRDEHRREVRRAEERRDTGRDHYPERFGRHEQRPNRNAMQHRRSDGNRQNSNNDHRPSHARAVPTNRRSREISITRATDARDDGASMGRWVIRDIPIQTGFE